MTKLDELLKMDGVMAAGEFAPDGTLVAFKTNTTMADDAAALAAQFCSTVTMMFTTLAGAFSRLTSMPWVPQQGWAYSGGDLTVAVGGRVGVFVKTEKADFNRLFQVLVG
jgi:roadblock/LC7 domain-containing protein